MEPDAVPDAAQVGLVVALDRQPRDLGQPAPLLEHPRDVGEQARGLRQREVGAPQRLPGDTAPLHGGQGGVDLRQHRRRQPEAPVVGGSQFLAAPDLRTI
jgi:hypothetical protein